MRCCVQIRQKKTSFDFLISGYLTFRGCRHWSLYVLCIILNQGALFFMLYDSDRRTLYTLNQHHMESISNVSNSINVSNANNALLADNSSQQLNRAALIRYREQNTVNHSYIFLGSPLASGGDLLASLLDSHLAVTCRDMPQLVPRSLLWYITDVARPLSRGEMRYAALSVNDARRAMSSFIAQLITASSGSFQEKDTPMVRRRRQCRRDGSLFFYAPVLAKLLPNSRFLLLLRDGRGIAASKAMRNNTTKYPLTVLLKRWNDEISTMAATCKAIGPQRCFPVYYELLLLDPQRTLGHVLKFLDLPLSMGPHPLLVQGSWTIKDFGTHSGLPEVQSKELLNQEIVSQLPKDQLKSLVGWMTQSDLTSPVAATLAPLLSQLGYGNIKSVSDYLSINAISCDNDSCNCNTTTAPTKFECRNPRFWSDSLT